MDSLSKKIQNLGIHDIRNAARFAQNMIVQYEPYQIDIRRATNTDAWGPTPKHLEKVLRNRYQVPLYLLTEYTLKRLVDHVATRPKNLYEKARKDYVNYGSEWRVVLKCLVVIEFLLLNVADGDELNQVRSCLVTHKHLLSREVAQYRVAMSNDGKMEVHERGIRKKCENILQLLDDTQYLKKERRAHAKNNLKIRQQAESSLYNANPIDTSAMSSEYLDSDEGVEEEEPHRRRSQLDQQRRQRRDILRERIKNTEIQRKKQQQQQDLPDLIDFDAEPAQGQEDEEHEDEDEDEDDDEFGDFQAGDDSQAAAAAPPPPKSKQQDLDLLNWDAPVNTNAQVHKPTQAPAPKQDAFADLFSQSKSLI